MPQMSDKSDRKGGSTGSGLEKPDGKPGLPKTRPKGCRWPIPMRRLLILAAPSTGWRYPRDASESGRRFGCSTAELEALVDWLVKCGVDTVVLEATGNYWVVLYDLLEERRLRPVVVNPRYAKNMSGKKGDIPDCQWMQKLHTYGLFANSFRPSEAFRALRTYLRQRESLVVGAGQ